MRRRLLVALVASVLLLSAACSSDDGGGGGDDGPAATNPPSLAPLNALEVHLDEPGETPRAPLVQSIADGATWDGGIQFRLGVEALLAARAVGDTTLTITDVDAEGNATAHYTLDALDIALGSGNGDPGQTTPDALSVSGDVVVAPDRSGTAASTAQVAADGSVPGAEGLASSLDPRLVFLLFPFPEEPVGVDAGWTITGEIPLFNTTVALEAQVQLLARRGDRYTLAATVTMSPAVDTGIQLDLRGLGRLVGDLHQLGLRSGTIGLNGTAVVPDRGPTPTPMSLRVDVDQRHSDNAGTGTTS